MGLRFLDSKMGITLSFLPTTLGHGGGWGLTLFMPASCLAVASVSSFHLFL